MNTKRALTFAFIAFVALVLLGAFLLIRHRQEEQRGRMDSMASQLESILENGDTVTVRPEPGNEIRALLTNAYGRGLLTNLDEAQERLAFDPASEAYVCIWNGPGDKQVMFVDPGTVDGVGLTSGILSQIAITKVEVKDDHATFWFTPSLAAEDEEVVREMIGLKPGERYRLEVKITDLNEADLIQIWRSGTALRIHDRNSTQQGGAGPATRSELNSEGEDNPQPESEVRSR